MFRPLFAILIAAAMLFAPFGMQAAMAAAPADHHSGMTANDHCDGQPAPERDNDRVDKFSCAAMCAAVAATPATAVASAEFTRIAQRPALVRFPHSYLAELPTPPPRRA